jgi:hypothetical protein
MSRRGGITEEKHFRFKFRELEILLCEELQFLLA